MSFRCDFCREPQAPGVTPIVLVTKVRNKGGSDTGWKGTDIAEEKRICASCHNPEFKPEILGMNPSLNTVINPVLAERT